MSTCIHGVELIGGSCTDCLIREDELEADFDSLTVECAALKAELACSRKLSRELLCIDVTFSDVLSGLVIVPRSYDEALRRAKEELGES